MKKSIAADWFHARPLDSADKRAALILFVVALAWRGAAACLVQGYALDEAIFGVRTVHALLNGIWPLHFVNAPYGFPLLEWIAAPFFAWFGPSLVWFRLPSILMGAAATAGLFLLLVRHVPRAVAVPAALFVACPTGLHLTFISLASTYGPGLLVIVAMIVLLGRTTVESPLRRYVRAGLGAGCLHFIFPQVRIYLVTWALIVLGPHLLRLVRRTHRHRQRTVEGAALLAVALLVAAGYHYLTRPTGYRLTLPFAACWSIGGAILAGCGWTLLRRQAAWRAIAKRWLAFTAMFVISALPVQFAYSHWQKAKLETGTPHDASRFSLKHIHQWPAQGLFFAGRIVPLALGESTTGLSFALAEERPPTVPRVVVGLVAIGLWLVAAAALLKSTKGADRLKLLWWLLPPVATALLITPSWNLATELQARYFTLSHFGVWLPFAFVLSRLRSRILAAGLMASLLAWNACEAFVLWPRFWNQHAQPYALVSQPAAPAAPAR